MNSKNILAYTSRLQSGENPIEVFTEIEIFYILREALNQFNLGNCRYCPDEYDSEAEHFLLYLLSAHEQKKIVTSEEFTAFTHEYILKQFREIHPERIKEFVVFLFQELHSLQPQYRMLRGKQVSYVDMLKINYQA